MYIHKRIFQHEWINRRKHFNIYCRLHFYWRLLNDRFGTTNGYWSHSSFLGTSKVGKIRTLCKRGTNHSSHATDICNPIFTTNHPLRTTHQNQPPKANGQTITTHVSLHRHASNSLVHKAKNFQIVLRFFVLHIHLDLCAGEKRFFAHSP